jgi:hypothetical protein
LLFISRRLQGIIRTHYIQATAVKSGQKLLSGSVHCWMAAQEQECGRSFTLEKGSGCA